MAVPQAPSPSTANLIGMTGAPHEGSACALPSWDRIPILSWEDRQDWNPIPRLQAQDQLTASSHYRIAENSAPATVRRLFPWEQTPEISKLAAMACRWNERGFHPFVRSGCEEHGSSRDWLDQVRRPRTGAAQPPPFCKEDRAWLHNCAFTL